MQESTENTLIFKAVVVCELAWFGVGVFAGIEDVPSPSPPAGLNMVLAFVLLLSIVRSLVLHF